MDCLELHQLPVPQVEPVAQLAPYLRDIASCSDALDELASIVEPGSSFHSPSSRPLSCQSFGSADSSYSLNISTPSASLSPSSCCSSQVPSPDGATSYGRPQHNSYTLSNPRAQIQTEHNPELSCQQHFQYSPPTSYPSSPSGSSSSSSSSSCSSYGSSSSSSKSSPSSPGQPANKSNRTDRRKLRNATAAERYRKRLKWRHSELTEVLQHEQSRNSQLRRHLEAKLAIYLEFAELLARNTQLGDLDLAQFGLNSLERLMSRDDKATSSQVSWLSREQYVQFSKNIQHFKSIQNVTQLPGCNQPAAVSTSILAASCP